ncbi:MAG: glycosyltransferase family 4 protein [Actinomycetia bacterium]|nr:glycosyltransferase family 4 protein [Actinomycetes bacterium]
MLLNVLLLNWRDMAHPEAGGAEKYISVIAEGLAARGHQVTFRTASYPGSLHTESSSGVNYVRSGGRLGIYPRALFSQLLRRHRPDVVVDVQNGVPYLSPLTQRVPVINLVHHVHKEQWPVLLGAGLSRVGWFLESQVAPRVYQNCQYVTVSDASRRELIELGVEAARISVIHNGTDALPVEDVTRTAHPSVVVLGRLVPQKRVEYAIQAVADLSEEFPGLSLDIVGSGWWQSHLEQTVRDLGVEDRVIFHGHVSEAEKHRLLARAWVHAMPSLKEGWGLVVVEAGIHGTPTVAFSEAGGPKDSIVHGRTGLLVDDGATDFTAAVRSLFVDDHLRAAMSAEVREWVRQFHWDESVLKWERLLMAAAGEGRVKRSGLRSSFRR